MGERLANPTIRINNEAVPIVPNSFKYTEGYGETTVEVEMVGNEPNVVTSDSGEDKMSTFKVELMNTEAAIKLCRGVKGNPGNNVVDGRDAGWDRVFRKCTITNNYEVELSATGKISLEWSGLPAQ